MTKHLNSLVLASVCAAAIAAFSTGANASMVTNGDFDGTIASASFQTVFSVDNTTIPGWIVSAGNVDWINNYWLGSSLLPGDHSVDLSGDNAQGTIEQLITGLATGQWYSLTFDTALNPDHNDLPQSLAWTLGSTQGSTAFGIFDPNIAWSANVFNFLWTEASTSALLVFASTVPGGSINCCYGPALDNVELNAVPLPAALPLFAAGLGVMGYFGSRRRRKAALAA